MALIDILRAYRWVSAPIARVRLIYARLDEACGIEVIKIAFALGATFAAILVSGVDIFLAPFGMADITSGLEVPGPTTPAANVTGVVDGMCDDTTIAKEGDDQNRVSIDAKGVLTRAPAPCSTSTMPTITLPAQ